MTLNELYNYAEKKEIYVECQPLSKRKALAFDDVEYQAIILNTNILGNELEEKVTLAEEIAHLESNLVYSLQQVDSPVYKATVRRCEFQARHKSATILIPFDELKRAVQDDYCREIWQIAEYFQVSYQTVEDAVEYYNSMGMTIDVPEEY